MLIHVNSRYRTSSYHGTCKVAFVSGSRSSTAPCFQGTDPVISRSRTRGWARITHHGVWINLMLAVAVVVVQKSFPSSSQLSVSATVLKKVWVRQGSFPQELLLSEADIVRGYTEVAGPTVLWVRNNSDEGFEVDLDIEGDYVSEVRVGGLSNEFVIGRSGGSFVQRGRYQNDTRFDLRWRLQLADNARAGRYPWPVRLQVQAK